jgi:RHS repeat-associated protein
VEFAYAGRPFEARTGLSDNRARWYEPAPGRFVNEDPSGFKGGDANLFRYVGNDPLNQVDPSGLAAKWASGAKASVPTAGWAALGQVAMTTSGGAAYAPMPVATATPLSLNNRVSNGSANATDQSGMAKRTLYQNIVREAYYLSNLMIGRRPSLNGGMEWAPRASVKPLVADIVVATPPLTPFALAGGGIALTRQGVGNFSDGIRGRALRGFDSDEIQNGVILGGVGGPVARAFPAVALPMAGVGIGAAAREFQNGEIEFAAFDAFLFAKPSTLGRSGAFGAARTGRGPFGYPSAVSTGAESAVNGLKLNKSLASQAQMGEVGTTMAGAGARVPFRDATRVAKEHGGNAADWVKKSSSSYTARDGATFETHWVENVRTGQRVEFKTKFPGVD